MRKTLSLFCFCIALINANALAVQVSKDFMISPPEITANSDNSTLAQVGVDSKGNEVVVWCVGNKPYIRRFTADGYAIAQKDSGYFNNAGGSFAAVKLSVAPGGAFVLAWKKIVDSSVYLQRFNADGTHFDMTATEQIYDAGPFDLAINDKGEWAIAYYSLWRNRPAAKISHGTTYDTLNYSDLLVRPCAPYVGISDDQHLVYAFNLENDSLWQRSCSYASEPIAWNGSSTFVGRTTFDTAGNADVAMNRTGGYVLAYMLFNSSNTIGELFGRRYGPTGSSAAEFSVAATITRSNLRSNNVRVEVGSAGYTVFKWISDNGSGRALPYIRIYNPTGSAVSAQIPIFSEAVQSAFSLLPFNVAIDSIGTVSAVCGPLLNSNSAMVLLQQIAKDGTPKGVERMVTMGNSAATPAVAMSRVSRMGTVVWALAGGGVIIQHFPTSAIYSRPRMSQVNTSGTGKNPAIAYTPSKLYVVWEDLRAGETSPSIYLQSYDTTSRISTPLAASGVNRQVSEFGASSTVPSIAGIPGRIFVVWQDVRAANGTTAHIYGQILPESGTPAGGNFKISAVSAGGTNPVVVSNGKNTFAVTWTKAGTLPVISSTLHARFFNTNGDTIGDTIRISGAWYPSASMDTAGNLALAWTTTAGQVYCRVVSPSGTDKIPEFRVDTGALAKTNAVIASSNKGAMIISWKVVRNGAPVIESRIINSNGTFQTAARQHCDDLMRHNYPMPAVAAGDSTAFLVWVNSHCLDTSLKDISGEMTPLVDKSTTRILKPDLLSKTSPTGRSAAFPGMRIFDLRGRYIGNHFNRNTPVTRVPGVYIREKGREVDIEKRLF